MRSYDDDDETVAVDLLDKLLGCFGVSATRAASGDWSCCVGVASEEEDAVGDLLARFLWRGTSAVRVAGGILSSGSVARVLLCGRPSESSVIAVTIRLPSGEESDESSGSSWVGWAYRDMPEQ